MLVCLESREATSIAEYYAGKYVGSLGKHPLLQNFLMVCLKSKEATSNTEYYACKYV